MNSITDMDDFDPQGDIQMPVGSMTFNLLNTCIKISKMSNIKKCKKWLMTPCNLFYSSNSMMEIIREGKYVVNTEQSINFDKTLVKISIQEIFEFNESIDAIMKDLSKFNIENDDQEKNLRGSHYLRQLNKDLEIERRTYAAKEETKMEFIEERAPRKKSRETSIRRRVSDPNHGLENNLINHEMLKRRKATRDSGIMDRTGSIANADDNSYQSRLFKVPSKIETDVRKEE